MSSIVKYAIVWVFCWTLAVGLVFGWRGGMATCLIMIGLGAMKAAADGDDK